MTSQQDVTVSVPLVSGVTSLLPRGQGNKKREEMKKVSKKGVGGDKISTFICVGMSSSILQITEKVRHTICHAKTTEHCPATLGN